MNSKLNTRTKTILWLLLIIISLSTISPSCNTKKSEQEIKCNKNSEWRDNNEVDNCSFYSRKESCNKIIGIFRIKSRLHKSIGENKIFEGGLSSRWMKIEKDSIFYFNPTGEIADKGNCECQNSILTINWELGDNLPEKSEIHFNSKSNVEFRYYDYPFNFNNIQYDTNQPKENPTKLVGYIEL